jgi:CheY-like chemotaxis protein
MRTPSLLNLPLRRTDRRREQRVPRSDEVLLFPTPAGALGSSIRARFVDRSPSGVGLTFVRGLPPGSLFILRLEQPIGGPLMLLFEVVRARNAGAGVCVIGGRFLRDLKPVRIALPPFDLVLGDIHLPDGDGCELMRTLREKRGMRCIAVTGHSDEHHDQHAADCGIRLRLAKPIQYKQLIEAMEACMSEDGSAR